MNNSYKTDYEIKYSEVDNNYNLRPDYIVSHFQDITGTHSTQMGIDAYTMKEKSNAFWVITKIKVKIEELPKFLDKVEIETWPTTVDRLRFGRDYAIHKNGKKIVSCSSEWITMDCDSGMPRRTASVCYPHDMPHREDRSGVGEFLRLQETVDETNYSHTHRCSHTDTDPNHHTNNVAYLRMMLDAFTPEEFSKLNIDEFQFSFLSQSFYGDEIAVYKKQVDGGFYIEGQKDGKAVFNCLIMLK